jgi:hypothetical protein
LFLSSVVDMKLFVTDPYPTIQRVSIRIRLLKSSGSDPKYLLSPWKHDFKGLYGILKLRYSSISYNGQNYEVNPFFDCF